MSVRKTFAHHAPTPAAVEKIRRLRHAYSDLQDALEAACPASRERSVAATHLEDSCMWAVKSIVVNDPGSVTDPAS